MTFYRKNSIVHHAVIKYTFLHRHRPTKEQKEIMLDYMEKHTLFARRQITKLGKREKEKYRAMLNDMSAKLNDAGVPKTKSSGWEKVSIILPITLSHAFDSIMILI